MLARTWHHEHPRQTLERYTSAELTELQAEHELSPWDERRSDMQAAMICAAIRTANGDKSVDLKDWIYKFDDPPETQQTVMARARALVGADRFERKK